ncbi:ANKR7 protein, partial [Polypterus senegalus]
MHDQFRSPRKDAGELHKAAAEGDLERIRELLPRSDINMRNGCNRTPLHIAAAEGHVDVVRLLAEHKADLDLWDDHGETPLLTAIARQKRECVFVLLDLGADPGIVNHHGDSVMHHAAMMADIPLVERLIEYYKVINNISFQNKDHFTPLHLAVARNHDETAEFLLEMGANENAQSLCKRYCAALVSVPRALALGDMEMTAASLLSPSRTPMMLAATYGYPKMVRLLLQYNVDLSLKDSEGHTATELATLHGNYDCAYLLTQCASLSAGKCRCYRCLDKNIPIEHIRRRALLRKKQRLRKDGEWQCGIAHMPGRATRLICGGFKELCSLCHLSAPLRIPARAPLEICTQCPTSPHGPHGKERQQASEELTLSGEVQTGGMGVECPHSQRGLTWLLCFVISEKEKQEDLHVGVLDMIREDYKDEVELLDRLKMEQERAVQHVRSGKPKNKQLKEDIEQLTEQIRELQKVENRRTELTQLHGEQDDMEMLAQSVNLRCFDEADGSSAKSTSDKTASKGGLKTTVHPGEESITMLLQDEIERCHQGERDKPGEAALQVYWTTGPGELKRVLHYPSTQGTSYEDEYLARLDLRDERHR